MFLKQNNIDFTEIDVSKDNKAQEEMITRSGQMGVPVVEIDGQIIVGFDKEKISEILKLRTWTSFRTLKHYVLF